MNDPRRFLPYLSVAAAGLLVALGAAWVTARVFGLEYHWPHSAEEWVAWASVLVAYGTLALALGTFRLAAVTREEREIGEMREWATRFYRSATVVRNATLELRGIYQMGGEAC